MSHSGSVTVAELSQQFAVSEVSIRRDLQFLEDMGLLKRVHGGAVNLSQALQQDPLAEKRQYQLDKKERIGAAAARLIKSGNRVILDSGSTVMQVAHKISAAPSSFGSLNIITASMPVVRELGRCPGINLILLGGIYLPEYDVVVGPQTVEQLKSLHADIVFLGLTTSNVLEAEVDRAMAKASTQIIVLSDSSKIGVIGLATIMPITRIQKLVTDQDAPEEFVGALQAQGIEVILA
jgi:DeoR/GlpR family transcriptional regulator of sugar metabolism